MTDLEEVVALLKNMKPGDVWQVGYGKASALLAELERLKDGIQREAAASCRLDGETQVIAPCPWCNSPANMSGFYRGVCTNEECLAQGPSKSGYEAAIQAWNTQAVVAELRREVERLREDDQASSIEAAHGWMDEAVGPYCQPEVGEPVRLSAEHLRLRCESAAKELTRLREENERLRAGLWTKADC